MMPAFILNSHRFGASGGEEDEDEMSSAKYFTPAIANVITTPPYYGAAITSFVVTVGEIYYVPIFFKDGTAIKKLYCSPSNNANNVAIALYSSTTSGLPNAVLENSGSISATADFAEWQGYTLPSTRNISGDGLYYIAIQSDNVATDFIGTDVNYGLIVYHSAVADNRFDRPLESTGETFPTFQATPTVNGGSTTNFPMVGIGG